MTSWEISGNDIIAAIVLNRIICFEKWTKTCLLTLETTFFFSFFFRCFDLDELFGNLNLTYASLRS
jgi:hypothetical protein